MTALHRLAGELRDAGGLLADALASPDGAGWAGRFRPAGGPEYELLVEAIYEGYLQHYGRGRVLAPEDPDLALLAGDRLYALGLARLAELGDLEAVTALADVISLAAQAHAEGDPARAGAAWESGVGKIGPARPARPRSPRRAAP